MELFTNMAQSFLSMFETGGSILLGWITNILPMVVCLMTAVQAIVKMIGENRVEAFTKALTRWRIARYTLMPLMAVLFLGNPLCFTFGKFLDERYKAAYYDACVSFLHPVTALFPHANASELFVYMGIAAGISEQKLPLGDLAIRYFMAGLVIMIVRGMISERISAFLSQKQDVKKHRYRQKRKYVKRKNRILRTPASELHRELQAGAVRCFYIQASRSTSFYVCAEEAFIRLRRHWLMHVAVMS